MPHETAGITNTPVATINATDTQSAWSTLAGYTAGPLAAYDASTNYFLAGDVLRVIGTATSGTFAPTTAGAASMSPLRC